MDDVRKEFESLEELKPCPFCGCEMHLEDDDAEYRLVGEHKPSCYYDGLRNSIPRTAEVDADIKEIHEMWNARAERNPVDGVETCPHCGDVCSCQKLKKGSWMMEGDHAMDCPIFLLFDDYPVFDTKTECLQCWNERV